MLNLTNFHFKSYKVFFETKETNTAKTKNIIVALPVEKKLPDVRKGKNSTRKIKKNGIISLLGEIKSNLNKLSFFKNILLASKNIKNKIILNPTKPRSVIISK
jgi:hypothetical protein